MPNNVSPIIVLTLGKSLALTVFIIRHYLWSRRNLLGSNQSWGNSINCGCRCYSRRKSTVAVLYRPANNIRVLDLATN